MQYYAIASGEKSVYFPWIRWELLLQKKAFSVTMLIQLLVYIVVTTAHCNSLIRIRTLVEYCMHVNIGIAFFSKSYRDQQVGP